MQPGDVRDVPDARSFPYAYGELSRHPDPLDDSYSHPYPYAYADVERDSDAHAHSHSYTNRDANGCEDAHTKRDGRVYVRRALYAVAPVPDAHAHRHAVSHSN